MAVTRRCGTQAGKHAAPAIAHLSSAGLCFLFLVSSRLLRELFSRDRGALVSTVPKPRNELGGVYQTVYLPVVGSRKEAPLSLLLC